jgi:hypothetical protein
MKWAFRAWIPRKEHRAQERLTWKADALPTELLPPGCLGLLGEYRSEPNELRLAISTALGAITLESAISTALGAITLESAISTALAAMVPKPRHEVRQGAVLHPPACPPVWRRRRG